MKLSILATALMIFSIMSCNQEESIALEETNLDDLVSQLSEDDLFHNYLSILDKYETRQDILNKYIGLTEDELNNMGSEQVMSIIEAMYGFNSSEELNSYFLEIANIQARINEKFFAGKGLSESEIAYVLTSALDKNTLVSVNGRLDKCLAKAGSKYNRRLSECWNASFADQGSCTAWAEFRYRWALTACYAFN